MAKLTPQQLKELYQKLPQDLKDVYFSIDSANVLQAIGKKYNLAIDKIGELADETGFVMLGLTKPKDYIANLTSRLGVSSDVSRQIADEINQQIFAKVRESLKKIHGIEGEQAKPEAKEAPSKEDIIKEIEGKEIAEQKPEPAPEQKPGTAFEIKTAKDIFRMPAQESEHKYPQGDPYREPVE